MFIASSGSYVPVSGLFAPTNNHNDNLTLSHNLREAKYRADGSGRDGYAHFSNGGLNIQYEPSKAIYQPSGRFLPKVKVRKGCGDDAMPVHYKSDGSGRDYYIKLTNGGLTNPSRPQDPRLTFK